MTHSRETLRHDSVFERFRAYHPFEQDGWRVNFLGVRQRASYDDALLPHWVAAEGQTPAAPFRQDARLDLRPAEGPERAGALPPLNEEYLEWVDILEAVAGAEGGFTMIELGAGFGRWLVNAAAALRQLGDVPMCLVAVEAEPTHFRWLETHLRDNGIDPEQQALVQAAVTDQNGETRFISGEPSAWYGQSIDRLARRERLRRFILARLGRPVPRSTTEMVRAVSLDTLLDPLSVVDLLDMDVQGEEARVLAPAGEALDRKVRRVHIGTHNHRVEEEIRTLFRWLGWRNVHDYPCFGPSETSYGMIQFQDGVQTWVNSRLVPP